MMDAPDAASFPRVGFRMPGLQGPSGTPGEYERLVRLAKVAEGSGFDSLWVTDDAASNGGRRASRERHLEAYSLLGALAVRTSSVDLGVLATGPMVRSPAMVAKLITGVDVISHGRALLGMGVAPLGRGEESDREAVERLSEELHICRALLDGDAPSYTGRYYRIHRAPNRPRSVRVGGIPVVVVTDQVGAAEAAARCADAVIVGGEMGTVEAMIRAIEDQCRWSGRRRSDVAVIWSGHVEERPEATLTHLRVLVEMGIEGCVLSFANRDDHDAMTATGEAASQLLITLERTRRHDA